MILLLAAWFMHVISTTCLPQKDRPIRTVSCSKLNSKYESLLLHVYVSHVHHQNEAPAAP